ncbi:MAG: tetratricopeptide repeat protein [Spirochaetes bacterium]|nr:tetratricopeptide repeat protein [Spirochaetota bacterium]
MIAAILLIFSIIVLFSIGIIFIRARRKKRYERAMYLFKEEKYGDALHIFQELLAKNPKKRVYIWNIALCYEHLGNYEMALVEYNKLAMSTSFDTSISEVDVHYKVALLNYRIDNVDRAKREFQIVTTLQEDHASAQYHLGLIAVKKNELKKAMEYFENAGRWDQDLDEAFLELGKVGFKLNRVEKAKKALERALEMKPAGVEAHFYYGLVLEKERSYKQSIEEFEQAKEKDEFRFLSLFHLGNIYMALGEEKKAFESIEQALAFGTSETRDLVEVKYHYAGYLVRTGDINRAVKLWKEIESVQPHYRDVRNKIDIYVEINKSESLTKFITMNTKGFFKTGEKLCRALGVSIEKTGIEKQDFVEYIGTFRVGRDEHVCIVDIARWITQVGELPVRELLEKMSDRGASKGIFITSSHFTQRALDLSNIRPLDLIDRERLEPMLADL